MKPSSKKLINAVESKLSELNLPKEKITVPQYISAILNSLKETFQGVYFKSEVDKMVKDAYNRGFRDALSPE